MTEYIFAWITVAVLGALAELITPGGQNGKLSGHVRLIASLCVLIALLPTVRQGIHLLTELGDGSSELPFLGETSNTYDDYFEENLMGVTQAQCEAWVYDTLQAKYGISRENCHAVVALEADAEGVPYITHVAVTLSGRAILKDPHPIEAYVAEQLSAPCTVSVALFEE